MIASVKSKVKIPVIIGGGIRTAEQACMVRKAGADIIVTGTIVENGAYRDCLEKLIRAVKG
jgi:phosphoglycerol geranylgeranyltransferase